MEDVTGADVPSRTPLFHSRPTRVEKGESQISIHMGYLAV